MRTKSLLAFAALLTLFGTLGTVSLRAQPPRPDNKETFVQRLAKLAKMEEDDAVRFLTALGPLVQDELRRGKQVSMPGLGTFRVVRVAEHRDLRDGRPVTIPAVNTIEFVPAISLNDAANAEGAEPAETVPAFQFIPLPGQTPGQRVPGIRTPGTRIR